MTKTLFTGFHSFHGSIFFVLYIVEKKTIFSMYLFVAKVIFPTTEVLHRTHVNFDQKLIPNFARIKS